MIRIVLIDDSTTFLAIASRFLSKHEDLKVVGAVSEGRLAVEASTALQPDIVLVDLAMPDMSGMEVISLLRQAMPNVGIIALTFLEEEKYHDAVLSIGADAFVAKEDLTLKLVPTILNVAYMRGHRMQVSFA
ncbi:MAG: response regulator [Anaerolineae bacterium]